MQKDVKPEYWSDIKPAEKTRFLPHFLLKFCKMYYFLSEKTKSTISFPLKC